MCSLEGPAADSHLEQINSKLKAGAFQKRERGSGSRARVHHWQYVPGEHTGLAENSVVNK